MTNSPTSERSIDTAAAQAQVARVVRSEPFAASDRLQQFLRFIVDETLAGRGGGLKEYAIGVQVYGRGDAFDPKADSIVRSEARRLRARLATYYEGAGADDEVVIELPVGRYVPTFRLRGVGVAPPATTSPVSSPEPGEAPAPPDEQAPVGEPSRGRRAPLRALVAVLVLLGVALIVMVRAWSTTAPTHTVGLLIVPFERRAEIPVPAGALETASASGAIVDAGQANPDDDFRYDPALGGSGGYIFNLRTTGLAVGSYELLVTIGGGWRQYSIPLQVK